MMEDNRKNKIMRINSRAVTDMSYVINIFKWTLNEVIRKIKKRQ